MTTLEKPTEPQETLKQTHSALKEKFHLGQCLGNDQLRILMEDQSRTRWGQNQPNYKIENENTVVDTKTYSETVGPYFSRKTTIRSDGYVQVIAHAGGNPGVSIILESGPYAPTIKTTTTFGNTEGTSDLLRRKGSFNEFIAQAKPRGAKMNDTIEETLTFNSLDYVDRKVVIKTDANEPLMMTERIKFW